MFGGLGLADQSHACIEAINVYVCMYVYICFCLSHPPTRDAPHELRADERVGAGLQGELADHLLRDERRVAVHVCVLFWCDKH